MGLLLVGLTAYTTDLIVVAIGALAVIYVSLRLAAHLAFGFFFRWASPYVGFFAVEPLEDQTRLRK